MTIYSLFRVKNYVAAGLIAVGAALFSPFPAPAAGLGDLLAGLTVQSGCSQFTSPYGFPVPVRYYLPGSNCAAPAVILLHGIDGGTRYQSDYEEIGRGLAAKGYAAFIVYYYEGQPRAARPRPDDRTLPDPGAFLPWVETVKASVNYVQQFPGVNPGRVGILGMSLGGFVGSSAAENNPNIKSLVILSGGMPEIYAKQIRFMPSTLIVHGAQDRDVPVAAAYHLHDLMAQRGLWHSLDILPCEAHLPYSDKEGVAQRVLTFLDRTL